MVFTSSSNVHSIDYDRENGDLLVEFQTGAIYLYPEVSEADLVELLFSGSVGKALNRVIIPKYGCKRVYDRTED